jgi:succinate dehydrogenase hydrophobic anchor subunit
MTTVPSRAYDTANSQKHGLTRVLHENGLCLALFGTFIALLFVQSVVGMHTYNEEQREHGSKTVSYHEYLTSGHFVGATMENWESEFLQMAAFVYIAVFLRQKGSPESKSMDGEEEVDRQPDPNRRGAPWPVRKGGVWLAIYSNSLTLAFLLLFLISFLLHAAGGAREYSQGQLEHHQPAVTMLQFMGTSQFWFQSMQNWQSEFLAIGAMVYFAVYLRQKGSPESKPVDASHDENE